MIKADQCVRFLILLTVTLVMVTADNDEYQSLDSNKNSIEEETLKSAIKDLELYGLGGTSNNIAEEERSSQPKSDESRYQNDEHSSRKQKDQSENRDVDDVDDINNTLQDRASSRRQDSPRRQDSQRRQDSPISQDSSRRQDLPRRQDLSRRQDSPRRQDVDDDITLQDGASSRRQDSPRRQDSSRLQDSPRRHNVQSQHESDQSSSSDSQNIDDPIISITVLRNMIQSRLQNITDNLTKRIDSWSSSRNSVPGQEEPRNNESDQKEESQKVVSNHRKSSDQNEAKGRRISVYNLEANSAESNETKKTMKKVVN